MSMLSLDKQTLDSLISYFTTKHNEFTELKPEITQHLQSLADSWHSDGQRRGTYGELTSEYTQGLAQLVDATEQVLAFLNETKNRVDQSGL